MLLSIESPRRGTKVRRARATAQRPSPTPRSRAHRPSIESLERRLVMDASIIAGGLMFRLIDPAITTWDGSDTAGEVQVGLTPTGGAAFKPAIDIRGGFQLSPGADPTARTAAAATVTTVAAAGQAATPLFQGAYQFRIADALVVADAAAPIPSQFQLANATMQVTQVAPAPDGTVRAAGSFTLYQSTRLTVGGGQAVTVASVPSPNPDNVPAATAAAIEDSNVPDFVATAGGGTLAITGAKAGYDNGAFYVDGSASLAFPSLPKIDVTLGDAATKRHGVTFQGGAVTSVFATVAVDASLRFGSFTVKPTALTVDYVRGQQFAFSGGATLSQQGLTDLTLALPNRGLVLDASGKLSALDASVSGSFGIDGLVAVEAKNLSISYAAAGEAFRVWGGVGVTIASANLQSVAASLGTRDNPGLTIAGGKVTGLNLGIASAVATVAGASFTLSNVAVGYTSATKTVVVDGSAKLEFGSLKSVTVSLGDSRDAADPKKQHGLVFVDGTATAVYASVAVDAALAFGTFSLKPQAITFAYQRDAGYSLSGGAKLAQQGGVEFEVSLPNKGLVLDAAGKVSSLEASVSGVIGIEGVVAVEAKKLTVSYVAATDVFKVYGGIGVAIASLNVPSIEASLGDATAPGLVFTRGTLTGLNVGLTGTFSLFGLTLSPQGLTVQYSKTDARSQYVLSGGLTVNLGDTIQVGAAIDPAAPLTINVPKGGAPQVDFSKFSLRIAADIKGFVLDAGVNYRAVGNTYSVSAAGKLTTPGGIGFDASLNIVNGKLRDIGVGVSAPIPVGPTGLYITWVYGAVTDIDTNPTVSAAATLSLGKRVGSVAPILEATGVITVNQNGLTLSADPNVLTGPYKTGQVKNSEHKLGIFILDGAIGQFTGYMDLNWGSGIYKIGASGKLFDFITVNANLSFTSAGDLSLAAGVGVKVPDAITLPGGKRVDIPLIGGLELGSANLRLEYHPNAPSSSSYVALWATVPILGTGGIKYTFDNNLSFITDSDAATQGAPVEIPGIPREDDRFAIKSLTFSVPKNTLKAQFAISSPLLDYQYARQYFPSSVADLVAKGLQKATTIEIVSPSGFTTYYSLVDGKYISISETLGVSGAFYQPTAIPAIDTFRNGNASLPTAGRTARVISYQTDGILPLEAGTYTVRIRYLKGTSLFDNVPAGQAAIAHWGSTPLPPRFDATLVLTPKEHLVDKPTTVSQADLDTILVSSPVDSYNAKSRYTVSVYATTDANFNPAIALLKPAGRPGQATPAGAGVLVDQQTFAFVPFRGDSAHSRTDFSSRINVDSLPFAVDGKTPLYFYLVVNDGVNEPHAGPLSRPITPPLLVPDLSGLKSGVAKFDAPMQLDFDAGRAPISPSTYAGSAYAGLLGAATVRVSAQYGRVAAGPNGSPSSSIVMTLDQFRSGGFVNYIPPVAGSAFPGFDTLTYSATLVSLGGKEYTSTRVAKLVPSNAVSLSLSQGIYANTVSAANLVASSSSNAVPPRNTAVIGSTVRIAVTVTRADLAPGTDRSAISPTIRYALPAQLELVSWPADFDPTTGAWSASGLRPGESRQLNLTARVRADGLGAMTSSASIVAPNAAGSPARLEVAPEDNVAAASLTGVRPISGVVTLAGPNGAPLAGVRVVLVSAAANDASAREIAIEGDVLTDAQGRYSFDTSARFGGRIRAYRIYIYPAPGQSTEGVVIYGNLPDDATPSYATAIQTATISGTLLRAKYPSINGRPVEPPASSFSPKSGGLVYLDLDGDGNWDQGEPSQVTDAVGLYRFDGLRPGTYTVRELVPAGGVAVGADFQVVAAAGGKVATASPLRYNDQRTVHGYQFVDTNKNGKFDPDESGQGGWTFVLYAVTPTARRGIVNREAIQTAVSDPSGMYHFDNLPTGRYYQVDQVLKAATNGTWSTTFRGGQPLEYFFVNYDGTISFTDLEETTYSTGKRWIDYVDFGNAFTPRSSAARLASSGGDGFVSTLDAGDETPIETGVTLRIAAPTYAQAGEISRLTVSVIGADGQVVRDFVGTIHLASTDDGVLLPGEYTFTAEDAGVHNFDFALSSPGTWTINAHVAGEPDSGGTTGPIAVFVQHADRIAVSAPAEVSAGSTTSIMLMATDDLGNVDPDYWDLGSLTVVLTIDGVAVDPSRLSPTALAWLRAIQDQLPVGYDFTNNDQGKRSFDLTIPRLGLADLLGTPGLDVTAASRVVLSLRASDPAGILGSTEASIEVGSLDPVPVVPPVVPPVEPPVIPPVEPPVTPPVIPVAPTSAPLPVDLSLGGVAEAIGGMAFELILTIEPRDGGVDTGATRTIRFVSSDPTAVLPPDMVLSSRDAGSRRVVVRLGTAGLRAITVVDAADGSPLAAAEVRVRAPQPTLAGRVVDAIFQAVLDRAPAPRLIATLARRMGRGASAANVARSIERGAASASEQVSAMYEALLGRAPRAAEARSAIARYRATGSLRGVELAILSGREYFRRQGSTPDGFLRGLGRDLLGREFSATERVRMSAPLKRVAGRRAIASSVLDGGEVRRIAIREAYRDLLLRDPAPREVKRLVPITAGPGSRGRLVARIVETPEFSLIAGEQAALPILDKPARIRPTTAR